MAIPMHTRERGWGSFVGPPTTSTILTTKTEDYPLGFKTRTKSMKFNRQLNTRLECWELLVIWFGCTPKRFYNHRQKIQKIKKTTQAWTVTVERLETGFWVNPSLNMLSLTWLACKVFHQGAISAWHLGFFGSDLNLLA